MFEKTITSPAFDAAPAGDALRTPEWDELVARLTASRDLRRALGESLGAGKGSFACFAAHEEPGVNGEAVFINPNGLAHGKADGRMIAGAANDAASADRETR